MTDHLLIVNLGPVQDFIASARRCQDLWFSSWLLSELSRVTAETIQAQAGGGALIFPGSLDLDSDQRPAVANKIVAWLRAGLDPRTVAEQARTKMDERLRGLAARAHGKLPPTAYFDAELRELARRQVEDLMEVQWVAVPLQGDTPGAYARAPASAERLLSARKARARWSQVAPASEGGWGGGIPKSSLDGQRESVLHEALYDAPRTTSATRGCAARGPSSTAPPTWPLRRSAPASPRTARAPMSMRTHGCSSRSAKTERRTRAATSRSAGPAARSTSRTPSTASPATAGPAARFAFLYIAQLPALLDELRPRFAEARPVERENVLAPLQKKLRGLLEALGLSEDDVPAYYATLLADGDSMGAALERVGEAKGIEGHRRVSEALDAFSRGCRETVHQHAGSLIYSGGDDVLALLPLHTVMRCGRKLHDDFARMVGGALRELGDEGDPPTLSMGVGIAHHLDDMADARRLAHRAEERAKGRKPPLDERLVTWAKLLLEEAIPDKAAYDLEQAMAPLLEGGAPAELSNVARSLATRVLDRKRGERGAEELSQDVRSLVDACLLRRDVATAVQALSHELQIARLLAGALRVAFEAPKPKEGT